jgi:hypothetical protein
MTVTREAEVRLFFRTAAFFYITQALHNTSYMNTCIMCVLYSSQISTGIPHLLSTFISFASLRPSKINND